MKNKLIQKKQKKQNEKFSQHVKDRDADGKHYERDNVYNLTYSRVQLCVYSTVIEIQFFFVWRRLNTRKSKNNSNK